VFSVSFQSSATTILFDAGGTLVYLDYAFLARELRRAGIAVSLRAIRLAEYAAKAEIDRRLLRAVADTDETRRRPYFVALLDHLGVESTLADVLIERFDTIHKQDNLWRKMLPSTPRVLNALRRQGLTLGVVSNSDGRITAILQKCGIAELFDTVIDSHDVGVEKPDPRIFFLALERLNTRPDQAVYVGDIYGVDVVGSERAGLQALLLDPLGGYGEVPCRKIRHLRELLGKRET
jgi:putative hydrolase of the HAD superfamily